MAQTQVTPVSQDEISKILAGNVESIITPPTEGTTTEEKEKQEPATEEPTLPLDFKWSDIEKIAEIEEPSTEGTEPQGGEAPKEDKKPGRKPTELVGFINELVEAGDLLGFEEGEAKTIEEAKELIKLNLQQAKEATIDEVKKELKASYSPQIQAILDYADQGGQNIAPLLSAIAEVEKTTELDPKTEEGQIAIETEFLKASGWEDEDIKEHIENLKDLGQLEAKASKHFPKLNQMKAERIQMMMEEQEAHKKQVEETRKQYLSTIENTLTQEKLGELKLSRQEKSKLWQSVADVSYRSFNGTPTNAFYKKLEELQVGKTADYSHFLELVYFAVDREGYKKKLMESIGTQNAAETAKKLKIQTAKATSGESTVSDDGPRKPVIQRGFKSPFG